MFLLHDIVSFHHGYRSRQSKIRTVIIGLLSANLSRKSRKQLRI